MPDGDVLSGEPEIILIRRMRTVVSAGITSCHNEQCVIWICKINHHTHHRTMEHLKWAPAEVHCHAKCSGRSPNGIGAEFYVVPGLLLLQGMAERNGMNPVPLPV